ncbi:hypothetical protein AB0I51_39920 [Streptomyces sp. NPDC050549]|uniref:FAD/NAD(P)-binding protein n=1 Tax=Streptomyces sp. NPDC050549 TaxID=3155406 RepID=UPI00341E04F5
MELHLADGGLLTADSAVLATGPAAPTAAWAPPALRNSPRFVNSPWTPGESDAVREDTADLLLVGTGLTAVDLALDRPGRTVHAASRSGLLPQPHALGPAGPTDAPTWPRDLTLSGLRRTVYRHVSRSVRTHGDWRPALDSLRPHTARLWRSLTPEERGEFLAHQSAIWNTHRHRMAPTTAESVTRARIARRLQVHTGTIAEVVEDGERLVITLSNGRTLHVGWGIDCTGPGQRLEDPLWRGLFAAGMAVPGPLGMGVATRDGRLLDAQGRCARPLFTLGAPRRGELWETTAIPEIRVQAAALARQLFAHYLLRRARFAAPPAAGPSTDSDSRSPPTPRPPPATAADSTGSSKYAPGPRTPSPARSPWTPDSPWATRRWPSSATSAGPPSTYPAPLPTPGAAPTNGPASGSGPSWT